MVKIRDKSCLAYWKQLNCSIKALIVSLQLPGTDTKDGKVFMTEELCDKPQSKFNQENPLANRFHVKVQPRNQSQSKHDITMMAILISVSPI